MNKVTAQNKQFKKDQKYIRWFGGDHVWSHVDEFKSNVFQLVNVLKIVDRTREHCCRASGLRTRKFNNCGLFCLCYITKHLMTAPSGNICFISLESRENIEILGKQNRCPREQSLSVYCVTQKPNQSFK